MVEYIEIDSQKMPVCLSMLALMKLDELTGVNSLKGLQNDSAMSAKYMAQLAWVMLYAGAKATKAEFNKSLEEIAAFLTPNKLEEFMAIVSKSQAKEESDTAEDTDKKK